MNAMRKRLGMIAPSSNSVLEPVTYAMLTGVPGISAHFSRFRVTEIALDAEALDQFHPSRMLPAADLLADAKVEAMAWNGTSASWLGIERDRSLCEAISARTGKPATTSTLACIDAVRSSGAQRVGFVTPYTDDVQLRIERVWAGAGIACHAERHLGLRDNFSFAQVDPRRCRRGVRRCCGPLYEYGRGSGYRCPGARAQCLDSRFRCGDAVANDVACACRPENIVRLGSGLSVLTVIDATGGALSGAV
jgi:maleate cis-trans isomerase